MTLRWQIRLVPVEPHVVQRVRVLLVRRWWRWVDVPEVGTAPRVQTEGA